MIFLQLAELADAGAHPRTHARGGMFRERAKMRREFDGFCRTRGMSSRQAAHRKMVKMNEVKETQVAGMRRKGVLANAPDRDSKVKRYQWIHDSKISSRARPGWQRCGGATEILGRQLVSKRCQIGTRSSMPTSLPKWSTKITVMHRAVSQTIASFLSERSPKRPQRLPRM